MLELTINAKHILDHNKVIEELIKYSRDKAIFVRVVFKDIKANSKNVKEGVIVLKEISCIITIQDNHKAYFQHFIEVVITVFVRLFAVAINSADFLVVNFTKLGLKVELVYLVVVIKEEVIVFHTIH